MIELLMMCAPTVDPVTMSAIVKQESGGHPWALNNNSTKKSTIFHSMADAIAAAQDAIGKGQSVDMGLAQINSKNLKNLGLTLEEVFEPCTNLAAGAKILEYGFNQTGNLPAALSMYNTGRANSTIGQAYAQKVFSKAGVVVPGIPGGQLVNMPPLPQTGSNLPAVRLSVVPSPEHSMLQPQEDNEDSSWSSPAWR
jgi:type IV secretion system protein VirB1